MLSSILAFEHSCIWGTEQMLGITSLDSRISIKIQYSRIAKGLVVIKIDVKYRRCRITSFGLILHCLIDLNRIKIRYTKIYPISYSMDRIWWNFNWTEFQWINGNFSFEGPSYSVHTVYIGDMDWCEAHIGSSMIRQLYSQNRIGILILTFPYDGSWFFWIRNVQIVRQILDFGDIKRRISNLSSTSLFLE